MSMLVIVGAVLVVALVVPQSRSVVMGVVSKVRKMVGL